MIGIRVYGIRRASVAGMLGLQNGDLLRRFAGHDLSSPESALEAYAASRSATRVELELTRRGTPLTITYSIVP